MKLFEVYVIDDCEPNTLLVVAKTEEDAKEKVANMDCWFCLMSIVVSEITEVDGYKIIVK